ncbi:LUD domain-containing protein [Aquimarina agarilytica]|uniref:LUD domain-containing protein n=1 Tax=Aquimarina agarilytica TaxID=1087449 RepID=UPI0004923437|nr:LUD domain-containing protein [Aquimarina agarilytica]
MSLFKRLFSSRNKPQKEEDDSFSTSKYMPENELPVDEQFMLNFREKGGKFLYCENEKEAFETFDHILLENEWHNSEICCFEEDLQKQFSDFNLNFSKKVNTNVYFASCEYLIGNSGGILVSSNQLKEKKLGELPDNFIIIAYTSQLINTISEGLKGIKNRKNNYIPTNITTIQLFEAQKENNFLTYGSSAKNLYLLLVEDL